MLNFINEIIDETVNDNRLFARYGYKFFKCIKKNPELCRKLIDNEPNFKNDFQKIFMSGLVEHFYKNNKPSWVINDKLARPWGYMSEYDFDINVEKNVKNDYLIELTSRGIYSI